eukprot:298606_1
MSDLNGNSAPQEEKMSTTNTLDDEQKQVLNKNIVITDTGTLSYFGDEDHNKLDIRIIDTEEIKGRILKHTSFVVTSSINSNITVSRRYNDFKWLHNVLSIEYLCIFIPPIADPNKASNILNKFNKEFISQRRYDLERFLNRIFKNKLLAKSQSFEVFLTQQSQTRFEEQQKSIKEKLLARNDKEIAEFIQTECYPDIDFTFNNNNNDDDDDAKQEIENVNQTKPKTDHTIYMEEIPRVREVYMRCDEKFSSMEKIAKNIFKIMSNIVLEISTMNEELYGLYDIENNEKPESMQNQWQKRVEICEFIGKWKECEQNQMYCFYKYFLLALKYEHQDCLAILDIFVRYDIVFNKYKKLTNIKLKQKNNNNNNNNNGVKVEDSDNEDNKSDDDISDDDKVINIM